MPYFPFNMFPYSNLHNLNLDWMLMTIQALTDRIMQYEGSATPYDDAPLMDGTASPGAAFKYARGDHRHPSDTSKFDKTGGTIMGIVDIAPRRVWAYLSAPGWYRVLSYESNIANDVMGAAGMQIDLFINRSGANNEAHKITLDLIYNPAFIAELSKSNNKLITKIRYNRSTAGAKQYGYVDIYYAGNAQNTVLVDFAIHTASPAVMEKVNAAALQYAAASPSDETTLAEYNFADNGDNAFKTLELFEQTITDGYFLYNDNSITNLSKIQITQSYNPGEPLGMSYIAQPRSGYVAIYCRAGYNTVPENNTKTSVFITIDNR